MSWDIGDILYNIHQQMIEKSHCKDDPNFNWN